MAALIQLRQQVYDILVEHMGDLTESQLVLLKNEARQLGYDNRQFDKLLQEVYSSINWSYLKDQAEGEDRIDGEPIHIFDQQVKSLNKLGEVLFYRPADAQRYLQDDIYLKANVTHLSHQNIDLAMRYMTLYHNEKDKEKRFLRVIYLLNPKLPYRLEGRLFNDTRELLDNGFKDRLLMDKIYQDYQHGKLSIWLNARQPDTYEAENKDVTLHSFWTFVYTVNPLYPYFIDEELFASIGELIVQTRSKLALWPKLPLCFSNGEIFIWFTAQGQGELQNWYQTAVVRIANEPAVDEGEKAYALVQEFLFTAAPESIKPAIKTGKTKIERLTLEMTNLVSIPIDLTLITPGFVTTTISLSQPIPGVSIEQKTIIFFDLSDQNSAVVELQVDPRQMEKNKTYEFSVQIASSYQEITIPVKLKAIFPLTTFAKYMLRYSVMGALGFAIFRWLISIGTGRHAGLAPEVITTALVRSLPDSWPVFFWVMIAMLSTAAGSLFAIRKGEKL